MSFRSFCFIAKYRYVSIVKLLERCKINLCILVRRKLSSYFMFLKNFFKAKKKPKKKLVKISKSTKNDSTSQEVLIQGFPDKAFNSTFSFISFVVLGDKFYFALYQFFSVLRSTETVIYAFAIKNLLTFLTDMQGDRSQIFHAAKMPIIQIIISWIIIDTIYRITSLIRASRIRPGIEYFISTRLISFLTVKPFQFFTQHPSSINNRIVQLTEGTYDFLLSAIDVVIPSFLGSLIIAYSVISFSLYPGLLVLAFVFIHFFITFFVSKKYLRISSINALAHNISIRTTLNVIKNMSNVKAFARESFEKERLDIFKSRRLFTNKISFLYPEKLKVLLTINSFLLLGVASTFLNIYFFSKGLLSVADVSFIMTSNFGVMQLIYAGTTDLVKSIEDIGKCKEGIDFFKKTINLKEKRDVSSTPLPFNRSEGVSFKNVSLKYPNAINNVFKNQTVKIKDCDKIGIVGLSGAGKTTFVNLIMGYFLPTGGRIDIGGNDVSEVDLSKLRSSITFMQQNASLFDRTILDNIKYGKVDATYEEVVEASIKANAHDFISSFPDKYYTAIQDGGTNLSGGQRQRITIARAILHDSPIIILDEATSAVDNHTQLLIKDSLDELMENKTAIIIAHKLETIKDVDRIFVFKGGRIVERGPHSKLLKNPNSYYKYLWDLQTNGSFG